MRSNRPVFSQFRLIRFLAVVALSLAITPTVSLVAGGQRPTRDQDPVARYLNRFEEVSLNVPAMAMQVRTAGEFLIVTQSQAFDVVLEPHELRTDDYRAEETAEGGIARPLARTPLRTYRGTAPGFPRSEARFSVNDEIFEGVILTPEDWYYIEPRRNFAPGSDPSEYVVYRRSDIRFEAFGTCATTLAERIGGAHELVEPMVMAEGDSIYVADVATEADYEYVTASSGADAANSSILDVLNQVDGIYITELGISLRVAYQHAWSAADDPYTSTSPSNMLSEFRNHWNGNFYSVNFDLAHMWTGKDMDGSAIGIAYLSVVCSARSYSYGISQRFNSSPGKYILTAHEIGHNFGATHTESASPPQADCDNTIMNSYIGTGTSFCPFSKNEVAAFVAGNSACLTSGPTAPSGLTAAAVSSSQVNLLWQDNSGDETGFRIERKTGAGGVYATVTTTAANTTAFSNTGLASGTTYYYRVQALSASGPSSYSNEAFATTSTQSPTITGIFPSSGGPGTSVTITGTNLTGATAVRFNATNAPSFTVNSPSQIVAVVPSGATSGRIGVTTPGGSAQSAADFIVLSCSYAVSPLSAAFSTGGGSGSSTVTVGSGCTWTATSNVGWVTVVSGGSGSGSGTVAFNVSANGTGSLRSGTLTVAGMTVTVTEGGTSCDINVDGSVNALDIQSIINAILGIGSVPAYYDLNHDSSVNVIDLQQLANVVLGINVCP
jgi:hypothetical protein